MKKKEIKKTLYKAAKSTRKKDVTILLVEEISELIEVLDGFSKLAKDRKHLCEEICDVQIMIALFIGYHDIPRDKIDKYKKSHKESFKKYAKKHNIKFNIESAISELTILSRNVCKAARKRDRTNEIIESIASVELTLGYLEKVGLYKQKDVDEFYMKKTHRLKTRLAHHGIF